MLRNPEAVVAAFREQWEHPPGSILTVREIEDLFRERVEAFAINMHRAEENLKFDQFKSTLHTVPTEFEQLQRNLVAGYLQSSIDMLLNHRTTLSTYMEKTNERSSTSREHPDQPAE